MATYKFLQLQPEEPELTAILNLSNEVTLLSGLRRKSWDSSQIPEMIELKSLMEDYESVKLGQSLPDDYVRVKNMVEIIKILQSEQQRAQEDPLSVSYCNLDFECLLFVWR